MFKKYFIFKNFDNLVQLLLGKAIIIKPGTANTITNEDNYSFATKNDAVITSWRTDDDVTLEQEIGSLAQSLINSTPFLKYGVDASTKQYIKFQDFYNIITRIKDLVFNPKSSQIVYYDFKYNLSQFSDSDKAKIENKTLRQLISSIRENPALYTRLVFELLTNNESDLNALGFNTDEKDRIYSLYKGIFATKGNSLSAIQSKEDYRSQNYFNLITQVADTVSSVKFLQYNMDDNVIKTRLLKDYGNENIRRNIENMINWSNARSIKAPLFDLVIKQLGITELKKDDKLIGIRYSIKDSNNNTIVNIQFNGVENNISYTDNNGKLLAANEVNALINNKNISDQVWKFIDKQLYLGIHDDPKYQDALKTQITENIFPELLKLSSSVLFNNYIAIVNGKEINGKAGLQNLFKSIYGENNDNMPLYNTQTMGMSLVSKPYTPLLTRIASAKSLATGASMNILLKDSEGKTLSQQSLSRLLGNLVQQYDWINNYDWKGNNKINPIKGMALMQPGVFRGVYTTRELKSPYGNKKHTKFTVSEFIQGTFLYDFVGGLVNVDTRYEQPVIGNNIVSFIPSINSDKETINRIAIDLNSKVQSKYAALNDRTYASLSSEEIQTVVAEQLGHYYNSMVNNIKQDFRKLSQWLNTEKHISIYLNIDDDFKQLNRIYKNQAAKQLEQWTREYNNTHTDNIALIDQTHYIVNKNGTIKFNNTIRSLQWRFNNQKALKTFMQAKAQEVLKSMLDEHTEIVLIDGYESPSKQYIIDNYPTWVKHGKMILARVGNIDILSIEDLKKAGLNPNKPHTWKNLQLHPLLERYNSLDYLFTQEYMYGGVGSHVNHPFKGTRKTPIVFKNPRLGLSTYLENNTAARHYIMDFDDEFNSLRNAWIASKIGVEQQIDKIDDEGYVYTEDNPDFQEAKNKYLAEHSQDEDFVQFISAEWNKAKELANQQNKILVCSQSAILNLFPNDFSKAFILSDTDSSLRGISQDWRNSMLQKVNNSKAIKYQLSSGTYFNNSLISKYLSTEIEQLQENEMAEEAARFAAQAKRNVSYTAAMHEFQLKQINGIPTIYNMAIMPDLKSSVYTVAGESAKGVNFDGATFVNPFVVIWENNSLNGDKAGINKKQFVHFYDRATGTGGIIKTAGFGLTNDKIRNSEFYRTMMYNMTHYRWKNEDGTALTMTGKGILQDFEGNDIDYGDYYYRKGSHYYLRRIQEYSGNNTYKVFEQEVNEYAEPINNGDIKDISVNSNYELWNMFGGRNSVDLLNGRLQGSENSIEMTARACNLYGTKKVSRLAQTADDVYQPLKHSDIHYMPTIGAVKQGAANINNTNAYHQQMDVNFMRVDMRQAGIQLDKEHHADNEDLSLMTQVISAACAMGYTKNEASKLYKSLYNLTKEGTKEFRENLGNLIQGDTDAFDAAVTKVIMKSVLNSSSSDGDMLRITAKNVLKTINDSKEFYIDKSNYRNVDSQIPYSDASIANKIVSTLTSTLTKTGIKTRMAGVLAVLNPAQEVIKFYKVPILGIDGKPVLNKDGSIRYKKVTLSDIEYEYNTDNGMQILQNIQSKQEFIPINYNEDGTVDNLPSIKIGRKYLINYTDGETDKFGNLIQKERVVKVSMPHTFESGLTTNSYGGVVYSENEIGYKQLLNYLQPDSNIKVTGIKEFILGGQDLSNYDVAFKDTDGHSWQLTDLDIIQDYFKARDLEDSRSFILELLNKYNYKNQFKQAITKDLQNSKLDQNIINTFINNFDVSYAYKYNNILDNYLQTWGLKFLNAKLQEELNSIRTDNLSIKDRPILVSGKQVQVVPESIQVTSYGLVMPKVFKSDFGLEDYDQIENIINNPDFFTNKMMQKLYTKVENYTTEEGEPVYNWHLELKRANGNHIYIRRGLQNSDLVNEVPIFKEIDPDGKVWRIDGNGDRIYQLFSNKDKVYKDYSGNEIIVTSDTDVFVDLDGNEVNGALYTVTPQGLYINQNTGEQAFRRSPIEFYLNNMGYNFVNINSWCSNDEIGDIHRACFDSISKKANNFYTKLSNIMDRASNEEKGWEAIRDMLDKQLTFENMRDTIAVEGNKVYNSFIKSLDVVAARIPSQNQASFMPMHIEAFENTDTNNAYVSIFQFFLQGSDLDIDSVSLQTFDFNHNGLYEGHSPYYNVSSQELMHESENLPFPTGVELQQKETDNCTETSTHQLLAQQYNDNIPIFGYKGQLESQNALFLIDIRKNRTVNVEVNTNSKENIQRLANILNKQQYWISYKDDVTNTRALQSILSQNGHTVPLTVDIFTSIDNKIKDALNQHYTYLNNKSKSAKDRIIKNYAVTALYNIIRNPINLREAQSSVDNSTKKAKTLANNSAKVETQKMATPGNVFNKVQLINENMVGKDGIGISATGLKSFFAATNMANTTLDTNPNEAFTLLSNIPLGGKVYMGLANVNATNINSILDSTPEQLKTKMEDYLLQQVWELDASNELSAFLSLSTD